METEVSKFMLNNLMYIVGGLGVLVVIMYLIIINLYLNSVISEETLSQDDDWG
jgi:hypothetical protein